MSGVGLSPVSKLLPIAGTWAAPFSLYYALLSWRIVAMRLKSEHYIGNTLPAAATEDNKTTTSKNASKYDALEIATRSHGNFLENVPLAFVFLALAELNGGNRKALNYVMATLFALRLAHVEIGLRVHGQFGGGGIGRPVGYFGSSGVLVGLAGYAAYLVKGYWGF